MNKSRLSVHEDSLYDYTIYDYKLYYNAYILQCIITTLQGGKAWYLARK